MKKIFFTIVSCVFCLLSCSQKEVPKKKALFILVDGISSDALKSVNTPNLDAISNQGGYARAFVGGRKGEYSETPTISAPGYNNLITGTWANKHNVWGNSIKNPNYNYWNIFRIAEKYDPNLKTAIFSTWLDNRTKLVGEGLPNAGAIKLDYAFDGFEHDTINFPHKKNQSHFFEIDELVTNETAKYVLGNGPDLSWVYLEFTDNMGHMYGDSPQFEEAIENIDDQIGRIWKAIEERSKVHNEEWMIAITTDHGRNADTGMGHGGQTDRERATWIVTNLKTNEYFKETPGIVDVIPSILEHMEIKMPDEIKKEMDGTSFVNSIAMSNLTAVKKEGKIELKWKSFGINERAKVFLSTTNNFKDGGLDNYSTMIEVNTQDEKATISVDKLPSEFYKIILESETNTLNTWIVK